MNEATNPSCSCPSLYRTLDPSNHEIRLITSLRVYAKDRVKCRLITVPLHTCPPFTALSYVWGEDADRVPIRVNGQVFQATTNLASALRYIPRHWKSKFPGRSKTELRVWADAVCINQSDLRERGHQVQLMKGIFSGAELVMCWMPNAAKDWLDDYRYDDDQKDEYLRTAFEVFELISNEIDCVEQTAGEKILKMPNGDERLVRWLERCANLCDCAAVEEWPFWANKNWFAVDYFFRLQYWYRLWIFQEIILAREPLLFCKSSSLSVPDTFSRVMDWFYVLRFKDLPAPSFIPPGLWHSLISAEGLSYGRASNHLRAWKTRHTTQDIMSSWFLFLNALGLTATDPKDYVYGILGVMEIDIEVDYSERTSAAEVLQNMVAAWLKRCQEAEMGDLASQTAVHRLPELWFLPWAGLRHECTSAECRGFASWAPNPSHSAHESSPTLFFRNVNTDKGVFSDKASTTTSVQGSSLFVAGVVIDTVHELYTSVVKPSDLAPFVSGLLSGLPSDIWKPASRRRLLCNLFELLCWEDIPTSILDTRLHESGPTSHDYVVYAYAFVLGLLSGGHQYSAMLESLGLRTNSEEGFMLSLWETFLGTEEAQNNRDADEATSWWLQDLLAFETTRRMPRDSKVAYSCKQLGIFPFRTDRARLGDGVLFRTSRGYFGFGTSAVAVGDLACVLKGYRSVALLRKNENHVLFAGECKVGGMVNGEAAELVKNGQSRVMEFELR